MATKTTRSVRSIVLRPVALTPPWTTEERLLQIDTMAQRINGYVQFMCQAASRKTTSTEVMEKAVVAFYEQMVVMESELGRIHDEFKLE